AVAMADPMTTTRASILNWHQGFTINLNVFAQANVAGAASNMIYANHMIYVGLDEVWTCNWQSGVAAPPETLTIEAPWAPYGDLFAAIAQLERLDEEDSRYIDADAARAARAFVSLLSLYSVPAPQLFSHGGDTVVFKWMQGGRATYLTLVDGT